MAEPSLLYFADLPTDSKLLLLLQQQQSFAREHCISLSHPIMRANIGSESRPIFSLPPSRADGGARHLPPQREARKCANIGLNPGILISFLAFRNFFRNALFYALLHSFFGIATQIATQNCVTPYFESLCNLSANNPSNPFANFNFHDIIILS